MTKLQEMLKEIREETAEEFKKKLLIKLSAKPNWTRDEIIEMINSVIESLD